MTFVRANAWIAYTLMWVVAAHIMSAVSAWPAEARQRIILAGRLYSSPEAPPLDDAAIVIENGKITSIALQARLQSAPDADKLDFRTSTVVAGFWNCHVHFSEPDKWSAADRADATTLNRYLADMLLSHGFVHVVDTGSNLRTTGALRQRINSGEIVGPDILMAGGSFVPRGVTPFYLRPAALPDVPSPERAREQVNSVLDAGLDGIEIFSGSYAAPTEIVPMDVAAIAAITDAAHASGAFVIAHPSNGPGAAAATDGGVDILAHTFPDLPPDETVLRRLAERKRALIPTLKLFDYDLRRSGLPEPAIEAATRVAASQVREFHGLGGQILFGTDVGYMTDYDPTGEYVALAGAGLTFADILETLTIAPAQRFGRAERTGRIAVGYDADVVILAGDPSKDVRNFAAVVAAVKRGSVVYQK